MVTPIQYSPFLNESLNKQSNLDQFDTLSIDSFDTLPDQQQSNNLSSSFVQQQPQPQQLNPSFSLFNGFTAEFKINKKTDKKMDDKQIQVDICYLPFDDNQMLNSNTQTNKFNSNKFRDIDAQVPTFFVLDDVFGNNFRRRSLIKRNEFKKADLFRSGKRFDLSSR